MSDRLSLGCLDVTDCRALVHSMEARQKACWVSCEAEVEMVSRARALFRSALERHAAQEQLLNNAAFERLRTEERAREQERIAAARAEVEKQTERQHRHTLERLAAEAERLKARHQAERLQQLQYLRQLSAAQRERRLLSCHEQGLNCASVASQLLQAAASPHERESLLKAQERYVTTTNEPALAQRPPRSPKTASAIQLKRELEN